ncbi:MAG: putative DNA-binding domain-containing protein [Rhodospirillales bacterium]|nr:putative DNA-binding domain-containing protein [Rhodospirillales bacterium]
MPTLHELQSRFATAIIDGDAAVAAGLVAEDAPGAAARLGIYLNHFRVTLIDTLAAVFPVVQALVGDPFFQAAARRYVRETPPSQPCLFAYGDGFPAFLERLPEARALVYLADVARLEWAINEAWHVPDDAAVAEEDPRLVAGHALQPGFRLHPSCRLIASRFPAGRIWQVHQEACADREAIDLEAGEARLLVHRRQNEVGWIDLPPAEFDFLDHLTASGNLDEALTLACKGDGDFNPMPLLMTLIEGGLISSIGAAP